MLYKNLNTKNYLKLLFSIATLLIFLDSYQVFNVPLTWAGNSLLTAICLVIYKKENMKLDLLVSTIIFLTLIPSLVALFSMVFSFDSLIYLALRIFSYLGFVIVLFVTFKSRYKEVILDSLKIIFYFVATLSIYFFIAQIFNIYEPVRNRPGTGILGFDQQTVFWSSGSHRMVGTFREPVFLVSIMLPCFLVLHYRSKNNLLFYMLSALIFGLTKSELSLILVIGILIVDIFHKKFNHKSTIFYLAYFLFFLLPIQECNISPQNLECPQEDKTINIQEDEESAKAVESDKVDNNKGYQKSSPSSFQYENRERIDTLSFTSNFLINNTGYGFQSVNKIYTDYLAEDVSNEMYLTNRTLPKYLKTRYLSDTFGTGRYFLTYEVINIQNNLLFNLFSIGMFYFILIATVIIYYFKKSLLHGLRVLLVVISISLGSVEDLLPLYGLYLGLMFTMELNES